MRRAAPARRGRTSPPRRSASPSTSARASTRATPTPARGSTASPPTCCGATSARRTPRRPARPCRSATSPTTRSAASRRARSGPSSPPPCAASPPATATRCCCTPGPSLTYTEIAHATGIPVGTVRSRIHRARTQLRAHLEGTAMNELEWLTERRPETATRRGGDRARARRALLGARGAAEPRARRARRWRGAPPRARRARCAAADLRPRGKAGLYALAAAVFAVAIVVAAGSLPSGDGPARIAARRRRPPRRRWCGSPQRIRPSPRRPATRRSSCAATLPRRPQDFTGADLYLDDGRYFYATTRAELRGAAPQEEFGQRQIAAAKAAIDAARGEGARADDRRHLGTRRRARRPGPADRGGRAAKASRRRPPHRRS